MNAKIFILIAALILFSSLKVIAGDFTDNGNGTVTDNVSGFMWQQEDDNTERVWEDAITYCEGLLLAGSSDWRLPNIKELRSIVDYDKYDPAIDDAYFPNTNSSVYWSSTTYAYRTSYTWLVSFRNGHNHNFSKSLPRYVMCIRGGQ